MLALEGINPTIDMSGQAETVSAGIFSSAVFPIALVGVSALILLTGVFLLLRRYVRGEKALPQAFRKTILLVTVPKESSDSADQQETIELLKNQIAVAESWFATLGGLRAQRGLGSWLTGRTDHFSFEIVQQNGLIS